MTPWNPISTIVCGYSFAFGVCCSQAAGVAVPKELVFHRNALSSTVERRHLTNEELLPVPANKPK